ncbi:hypothetical protein HMPREF9602_02511 [Cutibacterium acnes HL030PA2]|nr:hypothetical protein HMPREF9602_02511 [Cutibacterium acnes HL030PA2]
MQASFEGKSVVQLSRDTGIEYVTLGSYLRVNETCRYPWSTGGSPFGSQR